MGQMISSLFGGGNKGPSASEQTLQNERQNSAIRNDAEESARVALVKRAGNLRSTLGYRDNEKKGALGG